MAKIVCVSGISTTHTHNGLINVAPVIKYSNHLLLWVLYGCYNNVTSVCDLISSQGGPKVIFLSKEITYS